MELSDKLKKLTKSNIIKLLIILFLGGILRFTNINWDQGYGFHPDEPYLYKGVQNLKLFSQLDPNFYIYGPIPMYTTRAACQCMTFFTQDPSWCQIPGKINIIGRFMNAIVSILTIYMVFLLSRYLFSDIAGIIAGIILAFSAWSIREAHYNTVDTWMGFWLLMLFYRAFKYLDNPDIKNLILMGFPLGLSIATKPTSYLYSAIPFLAIIFPLWINKISNTKKYKVRLIIQYLLNRKTIKQIMILIIVSFLTFAFTSPFTLIHAKTAWLTIGGTIADIIGHHKDAYFTLQFTGTIPYLYQIKTMIWQSGLVALTGIAGLGYLFYEIGKKIKKSKNIFIYSFSSVIFSILWILDGKIYQV